jgi:parallel beta-helix repeat protein
LDSYVPEGNRIYNNLLNASSYPVEFGSGFNATNHWNTTNQTGNRIYSNGTQIGGNYYTNSSGNGFSDNCADVDKDGFCDDDYNVTTNSACSGATCGNNTDYLPLSNKYVATALSACGNLTSANTTYTLTQNVSSNGTCFIVQAYNVTLDCVGFNVNYSSSEAGYGLKNFGYDYATVRNCSFYQTNTFSSAYGVFFNNSRYGNIINNSIRTRGLYGYGAYFLNSTWNNITWNVITNSSTNYANGVFLNTDSDYNNVSSNRIVTANSWSNGVMINSADHNTVSFNNITTYGVQADGIDIYSSTDITAANNTMGSAGGRGVYIEGGTTVAYYNHSIDTSNTEGGEPLYHYFNLNNSVIENLNYIGGLYFSACNNITVRNITLDKDGIALAYSRNMTVANCSIINSTGDGVLLYTSSYNNLSSLNVTTGATYTYGVSASGSSYNRLWDMNIAVSRSMESI